MPILMPTNISGRVTGLYINPDREVGLQSTAARDSVTVTYEGFEGEAHGGLTRPSCVRVKLQYKQGTEIRNVRQITILSREELEAVAADMGIDHIAPQWIGANMVLEGIPSLTQLPSGSRLIFEGGASIVVDMENAPCRYPAEVINSHYPGRGMSFPKIAMGRRGVTGWVEKTGEIAVGETCALHIPPQRIYEPAVKSQAAE